MSVGQCSMAISKNCALERAIQGTPACSEHPTRAVSRVSALCIFISLHYIHFPFSFHLPIRSSFYFGGGYRVNPECVTVACCARTRWIHSHITIYTIPYLLHAQDEDSILDHHRQTSTGVPSHSHFDHDQHCPPPLVLDASPHGLLPFGPQQSGDAHGESTDCAFCTVSQFHD